MPPAKPLPDFVKIEAMMIPMCMRGLPRERRGAFLPLATLRGLE
jgi:hypothetical protein